MPDKPPAKPRAPRKPAAVTTQNPGFNLGIWIVLGLFATAFVTWVGFAAFGPNPPTPILTRLVEVCDFLVKSTAGALIGLVGLRNSTPDRASPPPAK